MPYTKPPFGRERWEIPGLKHLLVPLIILILLVLAIIIYLILLDRRYKREKFRGETPFFHRKTSSRRTSSGSYRGESPLTRTVNVIVVVVVPSASYHT